MPSCLISERAEQDLTLPVEHLEVTFGPVGRADAGMNLWKDSAAFPSARKYLSIACQPATPPLRKVFVTWFLAMASFAGVEACAQAPEVILRSSSQIPRSVALTVRPYSTGWVLLETSSDLASWRPVVNLLTTNSGGPFVDYPPTNSLARFYRVRRPGVSAAKALVRWQAMRPAQYRYLFQNVKLDGGGIVWSGTVTLSNGVKTVSGVTANDLPADSYDPADFMTPDEVFTVIAGVESQRVSLAHVSYDERWSFPARVVVVSGSPSPIIDFRISEFSNLSVGGGQAVDTPRSSPEIAPHLQSTIPEGGGAALAALGNGASEIHRTIAGGQEVNRVVTGNQADQP